MNLTPFPCKGEGLDSLRRMLSARFNRSRAAEVEEAVAEG